MASINRYSNPIQNSLETYVPLPFQEITQAASAIQQRGDLAEQSAMQTATGLASIEALAPAHKQYVSQLAGKYRSELENLMGKYNNNPSDPLFRRELNRLNLTYTNDPRLKTISEANAQIKRNQEMASRLSAEGKLFINPQFTGVDSQGNLVSNVGTVRGVNVLDEWMKTGAIAHQSIEDNGRGRKTNEGNLNRWKQAVINDVDGQRQLAQAYISQGYTPEQAQRAVQTEVQSLINSYGIRSDRDYAYDNYQLALRKAAREAAQAQTSTAFPLLRDELNVNPINFNKDRINKIQSVINSTTRLGGLQKSQIQIIEDNPENRKKYAGKFDVINQYPASAASAGPGAVSRPIGTQLRIKDEYAQGQYNPDQMKLLKEAREYLGDQAKNDKGTYLSDRRILETYKQALERDDVSLSHLRPNNAEYIKALDATRVGDKGQFIGNNWTLVGRDGELKESSSKNSKEAFKNLKGFTFAGINAQPFGKYTNGTIKVNAVDENGDQVSIFKPLTREEKKLFELPNKINQFIQSGQTEGVVEDTVNGQKVLYGVKNTIEGPVVGRYDPQTQQWIRIDFNRLVSDRFNDYYNYQDPYKNID